MTRIGAEFWSDLWMWDPRNATSSVLKDGCHRLGCGRDALVAVSRDTVATGRVMLNAVIADEGLAKGLRAAAAAGVIFSVMSAAVPAYLALSVPLQCVGMASVLTLTAAHFHHPKVAVACLMGAASLVMVLVGTSATSAVMLVPAALVGAFIGGLCAWDFSHRDGAREGRGCSVLSSHEIRASSITTSAMNRLPSIPSVAVALDKGDNPGDHLLPESGDAASIAVDLEVVNAPPYVTEQQALRDKLLTLTGTVGKQYRDRGIELLARMPKSHNHENAASALCRMRLFSGLVDSLGTLTYTREERNLYLEDFRRQLQSVKGNHDLKEKLLDRTSSHMRGALSATVMAIVGDSGTGKTLIANIARQKNGAGNSINLTTVDIRDFCGHPKVYVGSDACPITKAVGEAPSQFAVLHIDEVAIAGPERQKALLALLENQNEFVDQNFGVPLNKSRLFIICTFMDEDIHKIRPDLWSRLEGRIYKTTPMTREQCLEFAADATKNIIDKKNDLSANRRECLTLAQEVCEKEAGHLTGRIISEEVKKAVASLERVDERGVKPQEIDVAFASYLTNGSWATINMR